jgi:hypothetical protein
MSAEQWARAIFESAPLVVRWLLVLGWRSVLGLRLERRSSAASVLGWTVVESLPDTLTLEARSGLIAAQNVETLHESAVMWTTLVRYEHPMARPI